jgi:hypothetical protein
MCRSLASPEVEHGGTEILTDTMRKVDTEIIPRG